MTVLVTGGAGFIGSHVIERLLSGADARVVCLDDFNPFYDPALKRANVERFAGDPRVSVVEGSFLDRPLLDRVLAQHQIRQVVHLGAIAGVRPSIDAPLVYEEVNVRGTLTLLEAVRKLALERFVLVSSSTVYGMGAVAPFRDDGPVGLPLSPYGVTKRAAELLGLTYHQLHGVPVVCLRPFSVYGPRMRPDLAMHAFASAMLEDRPVVLFGDGSIERDFTHVSDICSGILAALHKPQAVGETFNLGHHQPVSIRGLVELLEAAVGRRSRIDARPAAQGDMPLTCADLTRSERILGYRPRIALEDGVREFVQWLREWRER